MKKNSFMEGALIATFAIVFSRIIGLFYVIPFFSIIGASGSILYGYAYSIYSIFLNLAVGGIPIAISKIVSELNELGFYYTKEKIYKLSQYIIVTMGFVSFLLLYSLAPLVAKLILGELKGGNTIEDVTYVIRIISTALLIVPAFSVTKGYLQGHKFIYQSSMSNIIEQLVRVFIIIFGSYLALNVFSLSVKSGVGISVFAATIGALVGFIYLKSKIKNNRSALLKDEKITREEAKITTKDLVLKIVLYALPFVFLDLIKSAYNMVDTFTIVSTMVNLGYSDIAEICVGVMTNWGSKLNVIVISLSLGITVSLIPNIASSFIKNNFKDISLKINQTLQVVMFMGLPLTIGIHFLAQPIWVIFYQYNEVSITIFKFFIFQALTFSIFSLLITIFQTMNNYKMSLGTLITAFSLKAFLNVPMMNLFDYMGLPPYYAPNALTLTIHIVLIAFMLSVLVKKYKFAYKENLKNYIKIIMTSLIMLLFLMIINLFIPIEGTTKLKALLELIIFGSIGAFVYILVVFKTDLIYSVFGKTFLNKISSKLKLNKKA